MAVRIVAKRLALEKDCPCGVRLHYDKVDIVYVKDAFGVRFVIMCPACGIKLQVPKSD